MWIADKSFSVLLIHEQQASQKWCLSSHHSTACGDYKRNIYMRTQAVSAKRLNVDIWHISNRRWNSETQINGVWRTAYEHMVADAFRSKKSSVSATFKSQFNCYLYIYIHLHIYIYICIYKYIYIYTYTYT